MKKKIKMHILQFSLLCYVEKLLGVELNGTISDENIPS